MRKLTALAVLVAGSALAASSVWSQSAPSRPYVVPADEATTWISPDAKVGMTILLDRQSVGSDTALSLGTFLPGSGVPEHVHEGSAEILYILNGEVEMTIGGRSVRASAGSAVYIPPDTPHSATVLGAIEPVKVVQIYAPGGPEQRFREWKAGE